MAFKRILALWKNRAPEEVWRSNKSMISGDISEHDYRADLVKKHKDSISFGEVSDKEITH